MRQLTPASILLLCGCLLLAACTPLVLRAENPPAAAGGDCAGATPESAACTPSGLRPAPFTPMSTLPAAGPAAPAALVPTLTPTSPPTLVPPSPTAFAPTPTPCPPELCSYMAQFFLERPIAAPGNDAVDVTYRFGSTQSGQRDPHHGVEFLNKYGTPVLAAADGTVVVAGTDMDPTSQRGVWPITYYGPYSNFYGNLVVIEHTLPQELLQAFPDMPRSFYSLYGHLSEIAVQVGQQVTAGQVIGKVGQSGIATGPHLHFEVRLGDNTYKASRNPELWLKPHLDSTGQPMGAIAGRFLDTYGGYLEMPSIVLEHLSQGRDGPADSQVTVLTYEEKGLRGQPPFMDSFAVGDLPAGWYRVSFPMGGLRHELVQVLPGMLAVVTFE